MNNWLRENTKMPSRQKYLFFFLSQNGKYSITVNNKMCVCIYIYIYDIYS
jgi:hypothetical protein